MKRVQMILGSILFVQIVLILLLRTPMSQPDLGGDSRPLIPGLEKSTPVRVEIAGDEGALSLVRDGEVWGIEENGGYPADPAKVRDLLDKLRDLRVRRPVVTNSRYHASLEVTEDEPQARLRLWDDPASGDPAADLLVGSSPNYRSTHVRLAGEDEVYEVREFAAYDVRPEGSAWVARTIVDVSPERVVGVTVSNAEGSFRLRKDDEGWRVDSGGAPDTALDGKEVESFVRSVTNLSLADPVGPVEEDGHGFTEPAATVTLEVDDGTAMVLRVGAAPPDNDSLRYVTPSDSGYTATVWKSSVDSLVEKKLEDLLEAL